METPVSKQTVFKGRIMSVRVDTVLTEDGKQTTREIIERPDTVAVVAIDQERNILLVRQFRYATGKYTVEIPAGVIDPGETPEQAARRELREETGYDCDVLIPIHTYWPAIGYSTEQMTIFLAQGLRRAPLQGDEDRIQLLRLPFADVYETASSGKPLFEDAKSTLGVILAASLLSIDRGRQA